MGKVFWLLMFWWFGVSAMVFIAFLIFMVIESPFLLWFVAAGVVLGLLEYFWDSTYC